ncbi:uncharacterized protein V1516DRAFT_666497 [Lipomyces oligophaga]|uniref:uncharacterized protein n=1 Tax=Lipomyces oligophaga TaxID=45792 RepID=UPI0034CED1B5
MGVTINSPLPMSLKSECKKAARILSSLIKPNQLFGVDVIGRSGSSGDRVIPPSVLANAKGLVVITVLKAGFLFSGRAGAGVVIARLPDGSWSAPSAIMTAGAGFGGQIGAELTDFVMILNTRAAVESFAQAGSITLGGNISIAAGPVGRNAEASGSASLKAVAAIFSYSKTRGLFAGVSLEGSVLVERRDANRRFYGGSVTAKQLLSGTVEPPAAVDPLLRVLDSRVFRGNFSSAYDDDIYNDIPTYGDDDDDDDDSFDSSDRRSNRRRSNSGRRGYDDGYDDGDDDDDYSYRRSERRGTGSSGGGSGGGPARRSTWQDDVYDQEYTSKGSRRSRNGGGPQFESTYSDRPNRPSAPKPDYGDGGRSGGSSIRGGGGRSRSDSNGIGSIGGGSVSRQRGTQAVALYTFEGEQSGDLGFRKGDMITIVKKSNSKDDWWTGRKDGKEGIFPANYVELV